MQPVKNLQDMAPLAGTNFYYSTLFHPTAQKHLLNALFAFLSEFEKLIHGYTDPGITRIKLQWWREEIERLFSGQPRHPLSKQLSNQLQACNLTRASFNAYIDHTESLINVTPIISYEDWLVTLQAGPGSIWKIAAQGCAGEDDASILLSGRIGALVSMLAQMQDIRRFLDRGQCPLPAQLMEKHHVHMQDLMAENLSQNVTGLFTEMICHIHKDLDDCYADFPNTDRIALLFCLIMARLSATTCIEIAKDKYRLTENRITLTPIRRLWIAWKTKNTSKWHR